MPTPKKSIINYQELSSELDNLMIELQRDDIDVDVALKYFERGLEIVEQLETYLKNAENTVTELKAKFSSK